MAHNPDALHKTLGDVTAQLADARDRGDFILADELHAKLTGLKASVAKAREEIVDGKFKYECSILEQQRHRETSTVTRGMRRMENDVNMHIEARVADLEVRACASHAMCKCACQSSNNRTLSSHVRRESTNRSAAS